MASKLTSPNTDAKGSKIPIPKPATSDSTVRDDLLASQEKKPPFQTRKSAEELKLRLASAVSAKIALGKDGKASSNNRGIGFLRQRKEQENRLNTKDISFQKSVRNGGNKTVETKGKSPNTSVKNLRNELNKTELQKSLLSALMNSRTPSGVNSGQKKVQDTRFGTASKLNPNSANKAKTNQPTRTPVTTSKEMTENGLKGTKFDSKVSSERSTAYNNGIKIDSSDTTKGKTSMLKKPTLPLSSKETIGNVKSKLQTGGNVKGQLNKGSGKILERAKNIESLLGQRQQNKESVEQTASTKDEPGPKQGINSPVLGASPVLNDENSKHLKLKTTLSGGTAHSVENSGKGRINNRTHNQKPAQNKTVERRKSEENFGKKIPPPVAKKPSKEFKGNSTQIQRKISPSRVNGLSLTGKEAALNKGDFGERKAFREDLLEKLEADVGDCKIAAFQSMEDFSALRIRAYRIRGDLDQLKRDREKRIPLVC